MPLTGVRGWLLLVAAMLVLGPFIGAIRIGADLLAAGVWTVDRLRLKRVRNTYPRQNS